MTDDDLPDPDAIYQRCVENCERLGIEPPSADRARQLLKEWNRLFAGAADPPSTLH